jgi:alkaline phosphatase
MKTKKILSLLLAFGLTVGFGGCGAGNEESVTTSSPNSSSEFVLDREFKNVILVIGDGMGENHILNCIDYYGLDIPVFIEDQQGHLATRSADSVVTDSAAGGTALATGKKVNNGNIALYDGEFLTQITTIAREQGMKTGVITTDELSGATPAAFSSHAASRTATSFIMDMQSKSEVDLLMGKFNTDYEENKSMYEENGYTYVSDYTKLAENKTADKLLGVFSSLTSEYISGYEEEYQLKEMTQFAVEYLDNEKGFFLMVEGAYIDKNSHNNSFTQTMAEMRSLIDTIEFLYEFASDGETAIFITADHETGGLQRETNPRYMSSSLFTSGNHTATDVPLYVHNYEFDKSNFNYNPEDLMQNTVVFEACKAIILDE